MIDKVQAGRYNLKKCVDGIMLDAEVSESRRQVEAGTETFEQSPSRADALNLSVSAYGSPVTGEGLVGVPSDCRKRQ